MHLSDSFSLFFRVDLKKGKNMRRSIILALVAAFLVSFADFCKCERSVHVELYYESLCPDCTGFITKQLYPTWNKLKGTQTLSISLYPFGNARETKLANGTYVYHCQHGEKECYGNFLEVCALKRYHFKADSFMPIIACIEESVSKGKPVEKSVEFCVTFLDSRQSFEWIMGCAKGNKGQRLMHKMAVRTNTLEPKHTWVPWIVINGVYRKNYQLEATTNLLKLVCELYKGQKPAQCN